MTHTYKVGDKGNAKGKLPYEILWVGRESMMARIGGHEHKYYLDGVFAEHTPVVLGDKYDLIPPKRRIQGWVYVITPWAGGGRKVCGLYSTKEAALSGWRRVEDLNNAYKLVGVSYIDIEEGLDHDH